MDKVFKWAHHEKWRGLWKLSIQSIIRHISAHDPLTLDQYLDPPVPSNAKT